MASLSRESNGRRRIQFVLHRKRHSIRLGRVSQRTAEAIKIRVEHLVTASIAGHPFDDETARWVAGLADALRDKLAAVGLVLRREAATLGPFLASYVASRGDVKVATIVNFGHTVRNLIAYFGSGKLLRDITAGVADEWRLYLVQQKLADATVRKRSGNAKQFFKAAVRKELLVTSPFADLVSSPRGNKARMRTISREDISRVLDACPDAEWRLIFALARYGGFRTPSEAIALRWNDIDWERNRITVRSSKTEHHEGKATRQTPLFPELLPYLREAFERAEPGSEHVITRLQRENLRTQALRIIRRAGLEPWPKPFQNLRSTRQTELEEEFPTHVVCAWLGNSIRVATEHYLQVTDEHFERATSAPARVVQNRVQHDAESPRNVSQGDLATSPIGAENAGNYSGMRDGAGSCDNFDTVLLGDTGLEPVTSRV